MKILVTGRDGQVARSLAEQSAGRRDLALHFAARPEVDLAIPGSLARAIEQARPDLVINAAAYTAVDRAEDEPEMAMRINADAAGEGAEAAARLDLPFIQLSTDYVFDGSGSRSWRESDPVSPINVYGSTKADGERQVLAASDRHAVVRTSWLVSPFGSNFIKTMLRLAADRDEISVVDDQRGSPTSTLDLADALLALADRSAGLDVGGIWHVAGSGEASWADLAQQVMATSAQNGGPSATIRRIATADYPTPARRPTNSVLDTRHFVATTGHALPEWKASIAAIIARLATPTA